MHQRATTGEVMCFFLLQKCWYAHLELDENITLYILLSLLAVNNVMPYQYTSWPIKQSAKAF